MRLVVAIDIADDAPATAAGVDGGAVAGFGFAVRQCLSYLIPNKTIKYSISAKNTNSVQDISHTCNDAEKTAGEEKKIRKVWKEKKQQQ